MKLTLNKEYAQRHLFVTVLMLALGGWFGYDGFIRYPETSAHGLYVEIEKSEPQDGMDLEAFKRQKTQTQYGFTVLCLLASAVVGLRLLKSSKFDFEFDSEGFAWNGVRHAYGDIKKVDDADWEKKRITRITVDEGVCTLDAWHHTGVKEFHEKLS